MLVDSVQVGTISPPTTEPQPLWRIAGLAGLLAAELLVISARTPHIALQDVPGLPGLVFSLGTWKVRILVTLAIISLLVWQSRGKRNLGRLSEWPVGTGIAWRWLLAHLAVILLFAGLTSLLFENRLQGLAADILVVGWVAAGAAAVVLAACAFLPAAFWRALLRGTGDVWAYVLVLGVGACVLAAYATPIWNPLAHWTLMLAWMLLRPFVPGLSADPSSMIFGTHAFSVQVAPACSGYEGIGLILAFTAGWLWFFRREWRFPRALLLIPLGVAAMWVFNAMRVAALVLIGVAGAPGIALQGFHSHAGWIAFNVVALGTCLAARRISWLTTAGSVGTWPAERSEPNPAERSEPNPIAPYLMPFLAILAAGMLAGATSNGFEWLYVLRVAAAGAALWYFRDSYRTLDWRVGWPAVALGGLVFVIWIGLEPLAGSVRTGEPSALAHASALARMAWLAVRVLGAVITVPIAEELAFRGFLLRRLVSADFESVAWRAFAWAPFLISSIGFGLMHGDRWLAGTMAGMIYAFAMLRRGRIGEAAAAHAVTNALLAIYVLATGNWQLW
jgi:exosortase E/protease (VPEID-CTERM system)